MFRYQHLFRNLGKCKHSYESSKKLFNKIKNNFYIHNLMDPKQPAQKGKDVANFENVLPNAVKGKVVTRFPPEPSGYLHIGHVKAAMLNYHYAKLYEGIMILRFDDTNPAKEKDEYVENIKKDLQSLEIFPDRVTHTSDYFDVLQEWMTKLIKEGKSYCDNTSVEQMRDERMKGIPSKNRELTPEENLAIWTQMLSENPSEEIKQYCVRGKIDYRCKNKCMRDPVFFRFSDQVHHRVGDKYKVFPTYDFACPIVDSIEGVTHTLRTNEYSDRIPMFKWVLEACGLADIEVYEYSRLNLIHTVLSKRNLKWFVENKIVEGWNDPRFPTVQGILRKGLVVQTLKDFMMAQGPSKNTNLQEWDKIWAMNRNNIDPIAKRLFAISCENPVEVVLENFEDEVQKVDVDWHQKNLELGKRTQYRYKKLLIEQDDAKELTEGQKLTIYKWGNSLVTKIEKEGDLIVRVFTKLTPEDTNFKGTKVAHWVPLKDDLTVPVKLVEFDHLITVKKMEEDTKIEDVVNKNSRFETKALAELEINSIKKGEIIQLERRGYYFVDKLASESDMITLHFIPDGKTKSMSVVSNKVDAKTTSKGVEDSKPKKEKKEKKEKKDDKAKTAEPEKNATAAADQ